MANSPLESVNPAEKSFLIKNYLFTWVHSFEREFFNLKNLRNPNLLFFENTMVSLASHEEVKLNTAYFNRYKIEINVTSWLICNPFLVSLILGISFVLIRAFSFCVYVSC